MILRQLSYNSLIQPSFNLPSFFSGFLLFLLLMYNFSLFYTPSQPNKILYCQESAVLQDIFEVLFLIGEPPIQHESRSSFPACFLPRSEIYKDASEFHDVVQSLHRLLVSLARHPEDRQMLLEEILLYIAKKDGPCSFISKAVCSVLANLLQTEDDIEFFINKGNLSKPLLEGEEFFVVCLKSPCF